MNEKLIYNMFNHYIQDESNLVYKFKSLLKTLYSNKIIIKTLKSYDFNNRIKIHVHKNK